MNTTPNVMRTAHQYIQAGISIIPIKRDGSKRPPLKEWNPYRERLATASEIHDWFGSTAPYGIATVCGRVSGNLEVMDFDEEADVIFPQWRALVETEVPDLFARLSIVRTPRKPSGYHVRYRMSGIAPVTTKLATNENGKVTLIETRGEGSYAIAPGSPAECHDNKAEYQALEGTCLAWHPPTITSEERDTLWRCAASFDRRTQDGGDTFKVKAGGGKLPGDDYCERGPDWAEILTGWEAVRQNGSFRYWRRPGKTGDNWSATTGCCKNQKGHDLLAVFSTNAHPFPGPHNGRLCSVHSKFQVFALLNHASDFEKAAAALREAGYGSPSQSQTSAEESGPSIWPDPQPLPSDLPPVEPFDYALLPDAFVPFVSDVAERMQCPPDFPAVSTMVALAGVVGKKIGIRPKRHDDWLVVPNVWGAIIGRPGIMKTPAIREAFRFLYRLEIEAKKQFASEESAYEVRHLVAEERKKQRKEAIVKAIKEGKDPEKAGQEIEIETPKEPTRRRYIVNDSTVEKLGMLLNENPNGLTAQRDELTGLLEHLDKEGQEGARAFYIEAWDGLGKYTYDRVQRGTLEIDSVTLSVFGGIQPGRLAGYLHAAVNGGAGDDGMMQRFQLAVYPNITTDWRNVDRWPDTEAKQRVWAIFQAMDRLDPTAVGAEPGDGAPFLRFDPEAQRLFEDWRAELEPRLRSGEEHPAMESHLAKYRSLVPSLALLIHLADGGTGPVTAVAMRKALAWARYLESHARRIYSIVTDPAKSAAKALARRIMKGDLRDGFALRSVYRNAWAGLDKQSCELAVELLVELGWLKEVEISTGGKPKTTYRINPAILAKVRGRGTDKTDKSPSAAPFGSNGSDLPGHSDEEWGEV